MDAAFTRQVQFVLSHYIIWAVPELPEVEILVRHLSPLVRNLTIRDILVRRPKVLAPTSVQKFKRTLRNAKLLGLRRRGKYLVFSFQRRGHAEPEILLGHLGMTGRMYLANHDNPLPKHAAVVLRLAALNFVFEDTRYFGRFTLDSGPLDRLGPEPLEAEFTFEKFAKGLKRSKQAIKVKLLDQSLVAGIGNIYASEALFRAGISPTLPSDNLSPGQVETLRKALREVLREAIACGSTVPLNYSGNGKRDGLFYFGRAPEAGDFYEERLRVYDRAGEPCYVCGGNIKRIEQAARSTYYCPSCQPANKNSGGTKRKRDIAHQTLTKRSGR
jgi:formamidopyrimidine-DNA glycosylase